MNLKRTIIFSTILFAGFFASAGIAHAATVRITNNVAVNYTVTVWYGSGSSCGNVVPTWSGQGVWGGNLTLNGMPSGCYTFNISQWPSGWTLTGISGASYQNAGTASWNLTWVSNAPPPPPPPAPVETRIRANGSDSSITVPYNSVVTIDWGSNNATSCSANGSYPSWQGGIALSGASNTSPMTSSATFGMTCTGPGGSSSDSITVNVSPPPAVETRIRANGSDSAITVPYNSVVTIDWGSNNATSCSATGSYPTWQGGIALSGASNTSPMTSSATFGMTCSGPGGSSSDSITVNVGPPPTTEARIRANNSDSTITVAYNSVVTIDWGSNNATSCTANGTYPSWQGPIALSGASNTSPMTATHTFGMTCTGPGGSISDSIVVQVNVPSLETRIRADGSDSDITVPYNSVVTIDWGSNYAISCTATGDYPSWQGPIAGSGASKTAPLTDDYTFGMTCTGSGGTTSSDSVKVKVSGKPASAPVTSSCSIDVQPNSYVLTTSIGSGSGTITGSGISCPGDCSEAYSSPTQVTLFATPAANGTFSSWSSGSGSICGGQGGTCSALIDGNKTATANFSTLASFDYTLSNSGTSNVTKTSGDAYTQNTITKTLVSGGTQAVTLSLSGVPNGTSYSISNTACAPNCTSVITFTVSPSTAVGTYQITVTGSPLNKQTTFNLVVSGNPVTVTCSASHSRALIGESVTWSAAISGGVPPLTYSWSGTNVPSNPAPNTNPFSISYNTIGQKTSVITVTDADGAQASCPATTVVYINFDPLLEEF